MGKLFLARNKYKLKEWLERTRQVRFRYLDWMGAGRHLVGVYILGALAMYEFENLRVNCIYTYATIG